MGIKGWSFVVLDFNGLKFEISSSGSDMGISNPLCFSGRVGVGGWSFTVLDFNGLNFEISSSGSDMGSHILYASVGVWALGGGALLY